MLYVNANVCLKNKFFLHKIQSIKYFITILYVYVLWSELMNLDDAALY